MDFLVELKEAQIKENKQKIKKTIEKVVETF